MKAVIFDLDDTLIHSKIDFKKVKFNIINFLQNSGVTLGLLNSDMLNFEIINLGIKNLNEKGFSKEEINQILDKITEIMNNIELESLNKATLIDGVPETLKTLRQKGLKIGVMTRSCREYCEKVFAKFKLRKYIDVIVARDEVENPKPNPEHAFHLLKLLKVSAEETLFVGDHWSDAECAKKSGLKFILVEGRNKNLESVKKYNCQIIKSVKELINII